MVALDGNRLKVGEQHDVLVGAGAEGGKSTQRLDESVNGVVLDHVGGDGRVQGEGLVEVVNEGLGVAAVRLLLGDESGMAVHVVLGSLAIESGGSVSLGSIASGSGLSDLLG